MSALTYLVLTRLKNTLVSLFHKPAQLLYVLFLIAMFTFAAWGNRNSEPLQTPRSLVELAAIVTGLYLFLFLYTVWNGFSRGGSIFSLSDVNLLFLSPTSRTRILFYGLFRQISTVLFLGFFIFYQYFWMRNLYGIPFSVIVAAFFGYVAVLFLGQVTAMTIYTFTSNNEPLKKALKAITLLLFILLVSWLGWNAVTSPDGWLAGLTGAAVRLPVCLFPIGGWLGWAFSSALGLGPWWPGVLLSVLALALLIFLLTHFEQDWYEDVLRTAEMAQSAIAAKKEGNLEAAPGKVRMGAIGLTQGWGASAFYYKHKIENRRGGLLLLPPLTLIFAVVLIVAAFFMREGGLLPFLFLSFYLQLFSSSQSRLNKELNKPFVYLVPEPPFSKLLQCLRELLPSAVAEAVLVFVPAGLILGLSPAGILICVFARISYTFLFQSGALVLERFWRGANKAVVFLLYFVILIAMALPGIALGVLLTATILPGGLLAGLLVAALVNLPVSLGVLYLLRNMLQYAEYTH
ncbi:MAG: putative ABC exporter domain-containing protein [Evtepia sp.]|uniref:putative ABC exporter domain-containing protein n=1 Tax=Evtepia sp. TaxID=2773933 RepID=UPI002A747C55|nr:putative ABC exporter domain-containing protein [Evtepia sp.]MDY3014135.1 putative ABC exporter domain-containing protein [Evtepia sp.]